MATTVPPTTIGRAATPAQTASPAPEAAGSTLETVKMEGWQLLEQVKRLIHEGNVRRITVKQDEHTIVEFPLTVGVVGTLIAPMLAAVGAIAALLADCTLEIERTDVPTDTSPGTTTAPTKTTPAIPAPSPN